MRILILGGNGFIGSAAVAKLLACGHEVTALARDPSAASRRAPAARWVKADLALIVNAEAWTPLISHGIDAVVNCAGVLQNSAGDDVAAVQENAMKALYRDGSLPAFIAALTTVATSLLDIALGVGVLVRRWSHISLSGMIIVSLSYLAGSVVRTPELWIDPLGPLIKVLPSTFLALTALAVLEER